MFVPWKTRLTGFRFRRIAWRNIASTAVIGCSTLTFALFSAAEAEDQPAPLAAEAPKDAAAPTAPAKDVLTVPVLLLKETRDKNQPISLLDIAPADDGIAGAKLGIADNNTTGKFTNQNFVLDVKEGAIDDLIKNAESKIAEGVGFIVADVEPQSLLKLADALKGKDALIINVGSADDSVREENCRGNVIHVPPTRTMLTDAIGQYLVWKKWTNWFLISGPLPDDKLYAEAIKRTAKRFGGALDGFSKKFVFRLWP